MMNITNPKLKDKTHCVLVIEEDRYMKMTYADYYLVIADNEKEARTKMLHALATDYDPMLSIVTINVVPNLNYEEFIKEIGDKYHDSVYYTGGTYDENEKLEKREFHNIITAKIV